MSWCLFFINWSTLNRSNRSFWSLIDHYVLRKLSFQTWFHRLKFDLLISENFFLTIVYNIKLISNEFFWIIFQTWQQRLKIFHCILSDLLSLLCFIIFSFFFIISCYIYTIYVELFCFDYIFTWIEKRWNILLLLDRIKLKSLGI